MGGGERMNDREVLEALLDGKIIVDELSLHKFHYRLIGDGVWVKSSKHKWARLDHIPKLDSDYVRVLEEE